VSESRLVALGVRAIATSLQSAVIVLSIQSLIPSSQVQSLLNSHRYEQAIDLADQRLRKLQFQPSDLTTEYQRISFQCFSETWFDDAGKLFANGNLDPRLLVTYYPGLRGRLFYSEIRWMCSRAWRIRCRLKIRWRQ
jgi:vacuolar protein sorting-associated protein 3